VKQFIEQGALRIGAVIQDICANVDFEIVSLPGGSFFAVFLWLYAIVLGFIRRAATQNRDSTCRITMRECASPRRHRSGARVNCACFSSRYR
jgi:hypothetical protein